MDKKKVLFVCVHNSARSQIAEALLKNIAGDRFEVESAGLKPGKINPLAIEVMKEIGIDISQNKTKSVFDFYKQNRLYDYVIAVCDESQAQMCPTFSRTVVTKSIGWSFADPASFQGTHEEKIEKTRQVRDKIKQQIEQWLKSFPESMQILVEIGNSLRIISPSIFRGSNCIPAPRSFNVGLPRTCFSWRFATSCWSCARRSLR